MPHKAHPHRGAVAYTLTVTLRAVKPDEKAPRKRKLTLTQAAKTAGHRELLAALRDRIAQTVEDANCPPVAQAALSRQLVLISRELVAMDAGDEDDSVGRAAATPDEWWSAV